MSACSSFIVVAALLLVVAQCSEVKSVQNQFKFLLNKGLVEKASAGYKPSVLNIPGSELLADTEYSASGFLSLSSSFESSCASSFKSHSIAVDSCISENSISYKFQLVKDSCAGAVVQYFYDDACSLFAGSSELEEASLGCAIRDVATTRPEYTSLTCTTASAHAHTAVLSDAAPSAEPTAMPTAPSARPTARPTTRPTVATTAFPTAAAPAVVSFKAVQTVSGISITQFNTNPTLYTTTLKQSIAATMDGVTENDFSSFVVTAGNTRVSSGLRRAFSSRRLQTSSIVATYTVQTTSLLTAEDLEDQLTNAVTSGDFNSILQTTAAINNATDLENATSESVEVESADGGSSNDDLSGGAIAGIVIGVVVGTVLIAMIIYYFAFMGGSFTSVNGGEAHVEL